jgi:hypothetical protein
VLPDKNSPAVGKRLDIASFDALAKMDLAAVDDDQVKLIELLCDAWMAGNALNQPIQTAVDVHPRLSARVYGGCVQCTGHYFLLVDVSGRPFVDSFAARGFRPCAWRCHSERFYARHNRDGFHDSLGSQLLL